MEILNKYLLSKGYVLCHMGKVGRLEYKLREIKENILINRHFYLTWNPSIKEELDNRVKLAESALEKIELNTKLDEEEKEDFRELLRTQVRTAKEDRSRDIRLVERLEEEFKELVGQLQNTELALKGLTPEEFELLEDELLNLPPIKFDPGRYEFWQKPSNVLDEVDTASIIKYFKLDKLGIEVKDGK